MTTTIAEETAKLVAKSAKEVYDDSKREPNGRYLSWEYCHKAFSDTFYLENDNIDYDYLSLQLAFYLASWGMYRGSSFLLSNDYHIHEPVVREVLKKEYRPLLDVSCSEFLNNIELFEKINRFVSDYYRRARYRVKGNTTEGDVSGTLVSKVLLGTLACVPAFDRYFVAGIKTQKDVFNKKRGIGNYDTESLKAIADFYKRNESQLEPTRQLMVYSKGIVYPQMKMLDMGFFQIGAVCDISERYAIKYKGQMVGCYSEYNDKDKTISYNVIPGFPYGFSDAELKNVGLDKNRSKKDAKEFFLKLKADNLNGDLIIEKVY